MTYNVFGGTLNLTQSIIRPQYLSDQCQSLMTDEWTVTSELMITLLVLNCWINTFVSMWVFSSLTVIAEKTKFPGSAHFHCKQQMLWLGSELRGPWKTVDSSNSGSGSGMVAIVVVISFYFLCLYVVHYGAIVVR